MVETAIFEAGGYRYVRHAFQYSGGVLALPGFTIERARFAKPLPLAEGFKAVAAHLAAVGRPFTSFCACELRSPVQFTEQGFIDFNRHYVQTLERWGIFKDEENPVARSNVCPQIDPPGEPSFEAFCYTVPGDAAKPSFVIAGAGEARDESGRIIALNDTSADGMARKARSVLGAMEERMEVLGVNWRQADVTQIYTLFDIHPFLAEEIVQRGAAEHGVVWYYAQPPIEGLEYEMDVRAVPVERVL